MSEIRKHYFLDEYCIIASGRAKRPSAPKACGEDMKAGSCVFCGGHEDKTPPAQAVYKDGEILKDTDEALIRDWQVRCIPNLYPALSPDAEEVQNSGFEAKKGYGYHEVIIESPSHENKINLFSDEEVLLLMKAYRDRVMHYQSQEGVEYVSLFKNWGKKAGASLEHTHSQLIAVPLMPPSLVKEKKAISEMNNCPYCRIIEKEKGKERQVYENDDFILIAPYFSRNQYEMWMLPKKHVNHISAFTDEMLMSLGDCIRTAVKLLDRTIPELAYNYMFYQIDHDLSYHFNVRIVPITSIAAGFEKNTDIYINTIPPEIAVEHLLNPE
jgi:UDPglucose--hexose-1-phosphate uridylyltransferase